MKNRIEFKKCLVIVLVAFVILSAMYVVIESIEYATYRRVYNNSIANIVMAVRKKYPDVEFSEIVDILNSKDAGGKNILLQYGIDLTSESAVLALDDLNHRYLKIGICSFAGSLLLISAIFLYYIHSRNKRLEKLTTLIERINARDYSLDLDSTTEDELSILKSVLYKTTIVLKESAENSKKDKLALKDSLSDISHQLKTPLTSIMISLDNLLEEEKMTEKTRREFLEIIKRETANINFLVQSLLKLSKLDTNTITFTKKTAPVEDLLSAACQNVSLLADLADVCIDIEGDTHASIKCDPTWQIEALSNILKNAVEHSLREGRIVISVEDNKIYTSIAITNKGIPIDAKDLSHIFERFYRGQNANPESVGIGLALAKAIIQKDDGSITVDSSKKKGTTFTIKYYKR